MLFFFKADTVFIWNSNFFNIWNNTKYGFTCFFKNKLVCISQKTLIAPELIDKKSFNKLLFIAVKTHVRSKEMRIDTASVDITTDKNVCICILCHCHIDNVILFEVYFSRAAGTFKNHKIRFCREFIIGLMDDLF